MLELLLLSLLLGILLLGNMLEHYSFSTLQHLFNSALQPSGTLSPLRQLLHHFTLCKLFLCFLADGLALVADGLALLEVATDGPPLAADGVALLEVAADGAALTVVSVASAAAAAASPSSSSSTSSSMLMGPSWLRSFCLILTVCLLITLTICLLRCPSLSDPWLHPQTSYSQNCLQLY